MPTRQDLKAIGDREGLNYEKTPLLSRQDVERLGQISTAEVGLTPLSGGRKFVEEIFDSKTGLYEPIELTDVLGTRFLVRKVNDEPPHVPTLDQVRSDVIVAWKMAQARPLAEKAAGELASQIKAKGATLKDPRVDGFRVVAIPPITRSQTSFMPTSMFEPSPVVETPIPDVPHAGEAFRDTYFGLQPGSVDVAPNQPKTVYYVMTLDRREPATFSALYAAPNNDEFRYKGMARELHPGSKTSSGWAGSASKPGSSRTGFLPTKSRKTRRPEARDPRVARRFPGVDGGSTPSGAWRPPLPPSRRHQSPKHPSPRLPPPPPPPPPPPLCVGRSSKKRRGTYSDDSFFFFLPLFLPTNKHPLLLLHQTPTAFLLLFFPFSPPFPFSSLPSLPPLPIPRNWLCFASTKPAPPTLTSCRQVNYAKPRLALFCHFSVGACPLSLSFPENLPSPLFRAALRVNAPTCAALPVQRRVRACFLQPIAEDRAHCCSVPLFLR